MRQKIEVENRLDLEGNPAGGEVVGTGILINWQDGPRGNPPSEQNGAFLEGVIAAVISRLEFFQTASEGKFANAENRKAILFLDLALDALDKRSSERSVRGVEGLNIP